MTELSSPTRGSDSGSVDAPLKPRSAGLALGLGTFEKSDEAERLARLAADEELVKMLQWCNFNPATPEWQTLARALVEYGYSVFVGWLVKGEVYRRARERKVRGLHRVPEGLRLPRDEAHAVAAELMIVSVEAFRENVLMQGIWNSTGGATLKTFFIGQSLFQLPTVYARWAREERIGVPEATDSKLQDFREHEFDPARAFGDKEAATALLSRITDPKARAMFDLLSQRYSYTEIAQELHTTEAAVRTRLSRVRKQLQGALG